VKAFSHKERPIAALWMHPDRGPRTVAMTKSRVTNFHVEEPGSKDTYTFCGLQILDGRILKYLPEQGFSSIIQGYRAAMKDGLACRGAVSKEAYWADVGTPQQYLDAHAEVGNDPAFVSASDGCTVAENAKVDRSVIWSGAQVKPKAVVRNAILGTDAIAWGETEGVAVKAEQVLSAGETDCIKDLGWNQATSTAIMLPARGSDRSYIRLHGAQGRKALLIRYGTQRAENESYVSHTRFLEKQGVPVPQILADVPQQRITLMQDLGNRHLIDLVNEGDTRKTTRAYKECLALVARFHQAAGEARKLTLQPSFDAALYEWERNLFAREFLRGTCGLDGRRTRSALLELATISDSLCASKPVLVHRDLQSTNIMLVKNRPVFIDYQGMRMGAAAYDLASFIGDPYVMLPLELQLELLDAYVGFSGDEEARELFWLACIQRLSQALGAYGRLGAIPATRRFYTFIPPALEMMKRSVKHLQGFGKLNDLLVDISDNVWPC
jgi:aminoglycoside/choline kinase family phosphotransferase